jgi:hypothetical protein
VVDQSYVNWPAVPVALTGTIGPDFPLPNKSFNPNRRAIGSVWVAHRIAGRRYDEVSPSIWEEAEVTRPATRALRAGWTCAARAPTGRVGSAHARPDR